MKQKALLGQLADTDIRLLRVFKVVAESGGVTAAELELNIGRSTISRHLKDLEQRLGLTLCRRGRSGFALTMEGRKVYQSALRTLGSLDEFRADVNDLKQHLSGTLTLALFDKTATNQACRLSDAIAKFTDAAPDVSIEIYVEPLNEIERGVIEGRFHCGVIPRHRASASLSYAPLFEERMHLYCGASHPLYSSTTWSTEAILQCRYAGLGYHSPNMEEARKLGLQRAATVYDQEAILHLLLSGRYIGYLPDHYAESQVVAGRLRRIEHADFNYQCQFEAIWRLSPKPARLLNLFLTCLQRVHE
ncbi:LysR family transcriptional regulator [Simiduia aestuariiviva]|uniref:DNA-binding transcriptional LysR family regulator n=1 Tax=Simiduia aestuariiviva TaxID=1510459 RepID=A0A839UNN0_9GAMM|nr:LysR family transcriptional regulator [Simiduia aestuariiviva]MBB3168149.1 DNA-binding transcriptional LysR family regulator [Simiduia aestuariiviva]